MKSLSPPTMQKALMNSRENANSRASMARLMSPPFLSPRGEGSRWIMWTAWAAIFSEWRLALDHVDGMGGHFFRMAAGHLPVTISELGDNLAPLFEGLQHQGYVKLPAEGTLHADFDIVEVYENSKLKLFFHEMVIARPISILARPWGWRTLMVAGLLSEPSAVADGYFTPKGRTHLLPQAVLTTLAFDFYGDVYRDLVGRIASMLIAGLVFEHSVQHHAAGRGRRGEARLDGALAFKHGELLALGKIEDPHIGRRKIVGDMLGAGGVPFDPCGDQVLFGGFVGVDVVAVLHVKLHRHFELLAGARWHGVGRVDQHQVAFACLAGQRDQQHQKGDHSRLRMSFS